MSAVLSATGVSVSFGAVRALTDVDLEVGEGKLVGLIGPNGAGKTTFIDAITGFVPASGTIQVAGREISAMPAHRRARLGLARTWQTIELFDDLSVRENLSVAARRPSWHSSFTEIVFGREPRSEQLAEEVLSLLNLDDIADVMPSDLPQGQRKLVGIARSLAARPSLLLLDEPAAGLDTEESQDLGRRLRRVVDSGLSTLLIDHDMGLVLGICDEIYVLDFGKVIAKGTPGDVWSNPDVLTAYLGETTTVAAERQRLLDAAAPAPAAASEGGITIAARPERQDGR